jgi:Arc/MetJ-type ribon-helix-helix transcriptional regulator
VAKTVTIEINQQQAQMLDRLIAEGGYGETYADVRAGLVRFCEAHPEFLAETGGKEAP